MIKAVRFALFLSYLVYSQQQVDIPWPTLADSPWPMVKHDPQFTGRSPFKGPQTATIAWFLDLPYGIYSGPVIGEDRNLYFGSYFYSADNFYCYSNDGNYLWDFSSGRLLPPASGILIDSSNTIYFGSSDKYFYALNADGSLKWEYQTEHFFSPTLMNIDLQGNLYSTNNSGQLFSFNSSGNLNWSVTYESGFNQRSPVLSTDGNTIYIAGKDSNLFALNLNGSLKWKFKCSKIQTAPIVDSYNNIYFIDQHSLFSIYPSSEIRWEFSDFQFGSYSIPAINYDGNIYAIVGDTVAPYYKLLISIDFDGEYMWKYIFDDEESDDFWQPLICDSEGTVYVGSTFGYNYYAIASDGTLKWKLPLTSPIQQIDNTGAISENGTLFLGTHYTILLPHQWRTLMAIRDTVTSVKEENNEALVYHLTQNFPNPFNATTNFKYTIPQSGRVTIKVFDLIGSEVLTLLDRYQEAGSYDVIFRAKDLASGIYFYTLTSGNFIATKKLILLK